LFLATGEEHGTIFAAILRLAEALIVSYHVFASGPILTRLIQLTLIDLCLTVGALVTWSALARVLCYAVHARGSVLTGAGLTLVNVNLTLVTFKSFRAITEITRSTFVTEHGEEVVPYPSG